MERPTQKRTREKFDGEEFMTVAQFEKENNLNAGSIRNPNGTCPRRNTDIEIIKKRYDATRKNIKKKVLSKRNVSDKAN